MTRRSGREAPRRPTAAARAAALLGLALAACGEPADRRSFTPWPDHDEPARLAVLAGELPAGAAAPGPLLAWLGPLDADPAVAAAAATRLRAVYGLEEPASFATLHLVHAGAPESSGPVELGAPAITVLGPGEDHASLGLAAAPGPLDPTVANRTALSALDGLRLAPSRRVTALVAFAGDVDLARARRAALTIEGRSVALEPHEMAPREWRRLFQETRRERLVALLSDVEAGGAVLEDEAPRAGTAGRADTERTDEDER